MQPIDGSSYERGTALCYRNHPSLDAARPRADLRTTVIELIQATDICFSFGPFSSACTGSQPFWFVRATSPSSSQFGPFSFSNWTIFSTMSCSGFSSTNPFHSNARVNHAKPNQWTFVNNYNWLISPLVIRAVAKTLQRWQADATICKSQARIIQPWEACRTWSRFRVTGCGTGKRLDGKDGQCAGLNWTKQVRDDYPAHGAAVPTLGDDSQPVIYGGAVVSC